MVVWNMLWLCQFRGIFGNWFDCYEILKYRQQLNCLHGVVSQPVYPQKTVISRDLHILVAWIDIIIVLLDHGCTCNIGETRLRKKWVRKRKYIGVLPWFTITIMVNTKGLGLSRYKNLWTFSLFRTFCLSTFYCVDFFVFFVLHHLWV